MFLGSDPESGPVAGQGGSKDSAKGIGAGEATAMPAAKRVLRRSFRKCIFLRVERVYIRVGRFERAVLRGEETGQGGEGAVLYRRVLTCFVAV